MHDVIVVERADMKRHVGVSIGQNIRLHWRGEKNQLGSVQDLKKGEILMLHGLGMKGRRILKQRYQPCHKSSYAQATQISGIAHRSI